MKKLIKQGKQSPESTQTEGINEQTIEALFENCSDIVQINIYDHDLTLHFMLIHQEALTNTQPLFSKITPNLHIMKEQKNYTKEQIETSIAYPLVEIESGSWKEQLVEGVFNGELLLYIKNIQTIYKISIAERPKRSIEEPNTEVSIIGPKEGFIEDISTNIALIRKRLKTSSMKYEQFTLGTRTKTKVALLYIEDIANKEMIGDIRNQLNAIKIDGIVSNTNIGESLSRKNYFIPAFNYTGRPDYVVEGLLVGRFAIMIDGNPTAMIAPLTLSYLIRTSEDSHSTFLISTFGKLFRFLGFIISLFLPGFWVSILTFHQDQLPYTLLATILLSRIGVPMPVPLEVLVMISLFELFKEAGMRMPAPFGQTLSVVGGLIIGQAAISAGVTAPSVLIIIAISVVASFTLVNQELNGFVRIIRIFNIFCSSIFGLLGFFLSVFLIVTFLGNTKSFGVSFLSPFSPFYMRDFFSAIAQIPKKLKSTRAKSLRSNDSTSE